MNNVKIAVVGLGYVGLPLALALAKKSHVVGFDISQHKLDILNQGIDPNDELEPEAFLGTNIVFTNQLEDLKACNFHIVAVPTPIDSHNNPDLSPLLSASKTVGKVLKKGDIVVYESTVYPGCTEDDCVPVLDQTSGLSFANGDYQLGYSPERINPGDKEHMLHNTIKIVSASDEQALEKVKYVYNLVVEAGLHIAPSIKVAEAAKIIENTQRDLNIALMNELSIIFNKMKISTLDVLEAAGTKWNFLPFRPGLVGGHCIGVDPYYLTHKAKELGYHAQIILAGRFVNDSMGAYVAKQTVKRLDKGISPSEAKILVLGTTFKENVSDIRNSKVIDIINELKSYGVEVDAVDCKADEKEFEHEYHIAISKKVDETKKYDAVIVAVAHNEYKALDETYFKSIMRGNGIFVDIKSMYRNTIKSINYWSL